MNICGRRDKFINTAVLLVCFAMLWGCRWIECGGDTCLRCARGRSRE